MNLEINCKDISISPNGSNFISVDIIGCEGSAILDNFEEIEIIDHFGAEKILDLIGEKEVMEYFNLIENNE